MGCKNSSTTKTANPSKVTPSKEDLNKKEKDLKGAATSSASKAESDVRSNATGTVKTAEGEVKRTGAEAHKSGGADLQRAEADLKKKEADLKKETDQKKADATRKVMEVKNKKLEDEEPPINNLSLFIFLGSPGIGKTTQAHKMATINKFHQVDPDDLIKHEITSKSKVGLELEELQRKNLKVPGATLLNLIIQKFNSIAKEDPLAKVILEDYPNCQEHLDLWKEKDLNKICTLRGVFHFTGTEAQLVARLVSHPSISALNLTEKEKEAKAKERLAAYNQALKPVLTLHQGTKKFHLVEAGSTIPRVFRNVLKHMVAADYLHLNSDQKPDVIFVIGGPGSGKTTQCNKIREIFKVEYIFIGDLLREEIKKDTPDALKLKEYINQGKTIPSEFPIKLLKPKIEEIALTSRVKQSILVDGFPFALDYKETWIRYELPDICEERALLYLDCSEQTLIARLRERAKANNGRYDYSEETLKKRLELFNTEMKPLLGHFDEQRQTARVRADKTPDEVYLEIEEILLPKVRFALNKRANILWFFGGPGAGKGTHCTKLSQKHGFISFSTKKLLDDEAKQSGELGRKVKEYLDKKEQVPDNLIVDVLRQNIIEQWRRNKGGQRLGFIIDGYPKTVNQIHAWEKGDMELVGKVKAILNIDADSEVLLKRIKKAPSKDDANSTDEQILAKINTYKSGIAPVLEYYNKLGTLVNVDADGSTDQNFEEIEGILRNLKYFS